MKQLFAQAPDEPQPLEKSGAPPLSGWECLGAVVVGLSGVGVGSLGFYASFDSVSAKAAEWGFADPQVLPIAIDSAIPVFTGAYLLLIRMGMPLAWARIVPWALSLITCVLNVASGNTLWSKVAHGSMSLLWVAVSEIAAHTYATRIGAVTGRRRMESVRWSRWLLAPLPTFLLWRRMKLWELTSYEHVLRLEQERLVYQAALHGRFGRAWRRKAPVESLLPLRLVSAGVPLAETAAAGLRAAGIEPEGIFAPAEELPQLPAAPAPAPAPVPASVSPAAAAKSRPVTAVLPSQPAAPQPQPTLAAPAPQPAAAGPLQIPAWSTEDELYEVIKDLINQGQREAFYPTGPLTGNEIAKVLGQSDGNGRKVRLRLIKTYAAECGIDLQPGATIDETFDAFAQTLTAARP